VVNVDRGQIGQVLINLATNARDAMPNGGTLAIAIDRVDLDSRSVLDHRSGRVGSYAVVSVTDTGVGMDEQTVEHIFEPFFTTKEIGKGTGLGLAMVYGTISQHGGFIEVQSVPGKGSTLKFYLPLQELAVSAVQEAASSPVVSGTETILLVEDDEAVRRVTKMTLEEMGYTVIEAMNGEQAIELLREKRGGVQLVITDVIMPGLSGVDVEQALREIEPGIKVLFVSGYAVDVLSQKGVSSGSINFMAKPLRLQAFSRKIREVLEQ
jgi:hypothetical protein